MHLLSTRPGGHVEDDGLGVVRVAQSAAPVVVLSAADTTLALLAEAAEATDALPPGFPAVRVANLLWLRQPASTDLYIDDVLQHARAIVVDHLGNPSDWPTWSSACTPKPASAASGWRSSLATSAKTRNCCCAAPPRPTIAASSGAACVKAAQRMRRPSSG